MALAGTTGGISGKLTDASGKPVAGATITAASPSQTSKATTGGDGSFSFASLDPDTYNVSAEKAGFDSALITGVTVFADQVKTLPISFAPKTIGVVKTTISGSSLVNSGQGNDTYTVTPTIQTAAAALGGGGALNQAYSGLASVPGVFIPQGQSGIYQSVYIRGGDYTQLGYEFDGVPIQRAFDQYPASALSALGQQNLQVYAGSGPLDAQSNGLAGFINQVIKTGSQPNFISGQYQVGTPTQYQKFQFEAGGATNNKLFSYYVGTAGYTQNFRLFDQNNGAYLDNSLGVLYNLVQSGCGTQHPTAGCYANGANAGFGTPLAPNGFANGPIDFGDNNQDRSLETVANFHIGIPHKDGSKDDIQLLYDNSLLQTFFNTDINNFGPFSQNVINGTAQYQGVTIPNCGDPMDPTSPTALGQNCALIGPDPLHYTDRSTYTGPVGVALTPGNVTQVKPYFEPNSPNNRAFGANVDPSQEDSYNNKSAIEKIQYQKNFGSTGYARIYGYSSYSDWLQNGPDSTTLNFSGGVSPDYELGAHTRGVVLTLADQVNSKNFVQLNGGYTYASTFRFNNAFYSTGSDPTTVAYLVSSANPTAGICYSAAQTGGVQNATTCGTTAVRYVLPGINAATVPLQSTHPNTTPLIPATATTAAVPAMPGIIVDNANTFSCGGAPCEFLTVNNGNGGTYNTVAPRFTNLSIEDRFRPTDKLLLDVGIHYDDFRYDLADTTVPQGPGVTTVSTDQRTFFVNNFINTNCQNSLTLLLVSKAATDACPSGTIPVTYNTSSPPSADYHAFEPRISGTYRLSADTVLRASYSKVEQPSSSAFQQYNASYGAVPLISNFYPIGFRSPAHAILPEESFNEDFSLEQQFPKLQASFSATPFFRSTNHEIVNVLLDPKTQFVSGINVGKKLVNGIELEIRKGNFDRDGFAAQLSYTYTHARVHYDKLPNGQTVIDGVNTSIKQYNAFTSFCAQNPNDSKCGGLTAGQTGAAAAPCYSAGGSPNYLSATNPTCAATDIANPYYNQKPQELLDPNAFYPAFNQLPGSGLSSVSSSYVIPHVASLLLQYKKGAFRFNPSIQFTGGGKYGSPTQGIGVDPTSCTGVLAQGVANDPRYPGGLPSGAGTNNEYDASTCAGSIVAPDLQTGHFDNFGEFTEPNILTGNLQFSYDVSKKVTLTATIANVYNQCFGGQNEPFTHYGPKVGCFYANGPVAYAGNFYNPGDTFQGSAGDAYGPVIGQVFQSAYGGQANPVQAFLGVNVRL